jgi:uncharacterized damage-inducible protein DinB
MKTDLATIQSMFKTNEEFFKRTINDVPDDMWLKQMDDGSNHLLWIVGHMLVARANVPKLMGEQWSAPWEKLFVRGAKRVSADQYPTPAEMRKAWDELSDKMTKAFANTNPEALASPAKEGAPTLDGTVAGTVGFLCLHETYHVGQLGYLHKWLGCGQAIG